MSVVEFVKSLLATLNSPLLNGFLVSTDAREQRVDEKQWMFRAIFTSEERSLQKLIWDQLQAKQLRDLPELLLIEVVWPSVTRKSKKARVEVNRALAYESILCFSSPGCVEVTYELSGLIAGNQTHFTSCVRTNKTSWHEFDDQYVTPKTSLEALQYTADSRETTSLAATVLIYTRRGSGAESLCSVDVPCDVDRDWRMFERAASQMKKK
jgi:hypothetical protein